jgi:L-aminopeptidase/D-esterase-like protein
LAVVNALGDVVDQDGTVLAGARDEDGRFLGTDASLLEGRAPAAFGKAAPPPGTNTTLVVVGTDSPLSRTDLGRLARMAAAGFPRAISPVNTPFDGDVLFALSSGAEAPDLPSGDLLGLGVMARTVAEESIRRAVAARGAGPTADPRPDFDGASMREDGP